MKQMAPRERNLAIATIAIVVLALGYHFVLGPMLEGGGLGLGGGTTRGEFKGALATLEEGETILNDYRAIAFGVKAGQDGRRPAESFSNELYNLLTQRLGIRSPRIEPPDYSIIEDVDEYYFVEIEVVVRGTYAEMTRLLRELEGLGLLIKHFRFESGGRRRREEMTLNVTVARLVKHDRLSRQRLAKRYR